MATAREAAAQIMEHLCKHDGDEGHGYSQPGRTGHGSESICIDGATYQFKGGDRDCSSAVISAYEAAGVNCGGATYTGNMRALMCATGNFEWKSADCIAQRGDIYLNECGEGMDGGNGHAAMCISSNPNMLAEFSTSENGGIDGRPGDQTGQESRIVPYYDCPWDGILHYTEEALATSESGKKEGFKYRVRTAEAGWLPEMENWTDSGPLGEDYAGNAGQPIIYLAMDIRNGWYQVQTEKSDWLPPVNQYNIDDEVNGCAGDGSPIIGVRCWTDCSKGQLIEYQVASMHGSWLPAVCSQNSANPNDAYAGNGARIDRVRARYV